MKKRLGRLAAVLTALAMLVTAISCKDPVNATEETKTYTVAFETNGASAIESKTVEEGKTLTLPDDPEKTGYDFAGWYTDAAFTAEFDAEAAITADTTLYAKWTATVYTITYNLDGGTNAEANPAEYTVETEAITLAAPAKSGYTFAGWYKESAFTTKVTEIAKGSTGNVTLYANWVANVVTHTVTFYDGTTVLSTVSVEDGKTVTKPTDPTKDGYVFFGWYSDDAFETEFAFTSAIKADTKVYAKLVAKLTSTWSPDTAYTGCISYNMVDNSPYGSTADEVMFNVNVADLSLSENDVISVEFKISSSNLEYTSIGCGTAFDSWGWHSENAKSLGSSYKFSFTLDSSHVDFSEANNLVGIKFVPQGGDDLTGKKLTIVVEDLKGIHTPYVAGAEVVETIFEGEFTPYSDTFTVETLSSYIDKASGDVKISFTYTLNDYVPEYDWDGVASLTGWKNWVDSTDDFSNYQFNTGCAAADYSSKIGTSLTKEFDLATLLSDLPNTDRFTINVYSGKVTFTKITVTYQAK